MKARLPLAAVLAAAVLIAPAARAEIAVIDMSALARWGTQLQDMERQYQNLQYQLHALTNVPQNLVSMVQGLLNNGVRNPLGMIGGNLQAMMRGETTGSCYGAQDFLTGNSYAAAQGNDFMARWINNSAARNAGLQACTQQMFTSVQDRLNELPGLLTELQNAQDVTQINAISARIQQENQTIAAQQQQVLLMAQMTATQRAMAEDQIVQKQRSDAEELERMFSPQAGAGTAGVSATAVAPMFNPGDFGG